MYSVHLFIAEDFDLKYGLRFVFPKIHIPLFFLHRFINYIADVWDYKEKFDSMSAKNETSAKVIPKTTSLRNIIVCIFCGHGSYFLHFLRSPFFAKTKLQLN